MLFSEIIGQEAIKERLLKSVNGSRISHAQLLTGPEGTGKLALAIAYAQYVCCLNRGENDSCGECASCRKFNKLIHPDLHFVFPVIKTPKFKDPVSDHFLSEWRAYILNNPYFNLDQWFENIGVENAQGMIYSHESNEIIRKLSLKTFESEYKVMIIWMPEKMHAAAANKLLKMIEEPPPKTLFLLVSENEEQIIGTIRSRTQIIKVSRIDENALQGALEKLPEASGTDLERVTLLARGNYIKALNLLRHDEQTEYFFNKFVEIMRLSYSRKLLEIFDWVSEMSGIGREKQKSFLTYALGLIRENFILNLKNKQLNFLNNSEMDFSKKFSPFINERNVIPLSEELGKAHLHIGMNGNPRIIFMDMALRIVKLIRA